MFHCGVDAARLEATLDTWCLVFRPFAVLPRHQLKSLGITSVGCVFSGRYMKRSSAGTEWGKTSILLVMLAPAA